MKNLIPKMYGLTTLPIYFFSMQLDVWAKERETAGLRASLNTLMSEIERLKKLCAERKEAEDSLRKKWKKIEEFDARRSELEAIYTALLKASMVTYPNFKKSWRTQNINLFDTELIMFAVVIVDISEIHMTSHRLNVTFC